jgi:hypothetical protein
VAFITGQAFMLPVQFKISFIMIKLADFPAVRIMTVFAVCNSIILKLIHMGIFMAIGTGRIQSGKLLNIRALMGFAEVACPAGLILVGPCKSKVCLRMIKIYSVPILFRMAIIAAFFRVIFNIDIRFMEIRMAIVTSGTYVLKAPLFRFFMAGIAGNSKVRAL